MAGIFVHLVIAREIYKRLPKGTIRDEGLFYAGSIAPDAIHAREGFVREDKKHTHLRDDILDRDFSLEDNLDLFHKRVAEFILQHKNDTDDLLDLYRGYVVHILTDELFILTVRQEFCNVMEKKGIDQYDSEFIIQILSDMNRNDIILSQCYEEREEIKHQLEHVKKHQIQDLLREEEISSSKDWVVNRYFYEKHEILEPEFISYQRILEFIDMAIKDICIRLSEGGDLPCMF